MSNPAHKVDEFALNELKYRAPATDAFQWVDTATLDDVKIYGACIKAHIGETQQLENEVALQILSGIESIGDMLTRALMEELDRASHGLLFPKTPDSPTIEFPRFSVNSSNIAETILGIAGWMDKPVVICGQTVADLLDMDPSAQHWRVVVAPEETGDVFIADAGGLQPVRWKTLPGIEPMRVILPAPATDPDSVFEGTVEVVVALHVPRSVCRAVFEVAA